MSPSCWIGENKLITHLHNATQPTLRRLRLQAAKPFGACHAPEPGILFDVLDDPWNIGGGLFKNTSVAIFPQPPCHEDDQRIEARMMLFGDPPFGFSPQFLKYPNIQFWCALLQSYQ
jgi:hypothetical protein